MQRPITESSILVVDDNEDNREVLGTRLTHEGYRRVVIATNGREALEAMKRERIDAVLLDIMMPEMNGYEVLGVMEKDDHLRDIPVIVISAVDDMKSVVKCIELGAIDYLTKPFDAVLLRARVRASLERKRLRDEVAANLERVEQELREARELQLGLLQRRFPTSDTAFPVDIGAMLTPAREVGGDFYDFFGHGRHYYGIVGDVSDKGVAPAMFMARTLSLLRMVVSQHVTSNGAGPTLPDMLTALNEELCRNNPTRMFVTLLAVRLDVTGGEIDVASAGHPFPLALRAESAEPLEVPRGTALGICADLPFYAARFELRPGEGVLLYTDGVTEALDREGNFLTERGLVAAVGPCRGASSAHVLRAIEHAVKAHVADVPASDDIAALCLRWRPA
ncbi:MAG: PP2C family protein-serine/threonine phosphatase [Rhodospirillaceae bacterium]